MPKNILEQFMYAQDPNISIIINTECLKNRKSENNGESSDQAHFFYYEQEVYEFVFLVHRHIATLSFDYTCEPGYELVRLPYNVLEGPRS